MYIRSKILKGSSVLLFLLLPATGHSQLLTDTSSLSLVKKEIQYIYNMKFREARLLYDRIAGMYPDSPVGPLIRGMITYWENYPLPASGPSKISFETDLKECIRIAEKKGNHNFEAEYLLANICARGFLLLYYSDNNLVMEVIPLASGSYKYLMRSFDYTSQYADFYYFTGVYNYYRDAYVKFYPVYKPLIMFFPAGDAVAGLRQLNTAAVNSIVLRAESLLLLNSIYMNFENNFYQGIIYSRYLVDLYPSNPAFLAAHLKNLLLLKNYDEAEKIVETVPDRSSNSFLTAQLSIFKGILAEKKYHDFESAQILYRKGILELSRFGEFANEYTAYCYFGLSRTSQQNGMKKDAEMYRKEALKLAAFKKLNFDE